MDNKKMTQEFTSWGDKLLQHTDILYKIQHFKTFSPVMIELSPTEACQSDCPFCSVVNRPIRNHIPFKKIKKILKDFKSLGAKSLEITGGGNPLLYADWTKNKKKKRDINDIIKYAFALGYKIGLITNSHDLSKIKEENHHKISWIRISLIGLDEGKEPEDYNFNGFPYEKLGFSYILYETDGVSTNRTTRIYPKNPIETIEKIAKLVELHSGIKFVRFNADCNKEGNHTLFYDKYKEVIERNNLSGKLFIKDVMDNDNPFNDGCYLGAIRPYIASHPTEPNNYQIYPCNSFVLGSRGYDMDFSLGSIDKIKEIWERMNRSYNYKNYPYEIKGNKGCGWKDTCKLCFFANNNKLLHTVANEMSDKDFI